MKPKLYIATPAYDGKVFVDYVTSLISTIQILKEVGIDYELGLENGDCYVAKARNKLARMFLNSDCTHLLFIDADVGWDVANIPKILVQNYDICLGAYPMKKEDKTFPVNLLMDENNNLVKDGKYQGLNMGATGFMCIKREVFEKLKTPELEYITTKEKKKEWNFFHCGIINGQWWGEDFDFCRKAVMEGFEIFCYPDITFRHWGVKHWEGNCNDQLKVAESELAMRKLQ